jgi:hypothetical protein
MDPMEPRSVDELYLPFAAAFVRGCRPDAPDASDEELVRWGRAQKLRLEKFKRTPWLPRVRRVIGALRAIGPTSLLDVGPGRGVFLWPVLEKFPELPVMVVEQHGQRASDLKAVAHGGIHRMKVLRDSVETLDLAPHCADVVTVLEVLEHMVDPRLGAERTVHWARRFVIASVPSKPDDNPEHIHLFDVDRLRELYEDAGALSVQIDHVLNHRIMIARVAP